MFKYALKPDKNDRNMLKDAKQKSECMYNMLRLYLTSPNCTFEIDF